MRRRSLASRAAGLAGALGLALGAAAAGAQGGQAGVPLLTLGGDWIVVRYTPGALDRADNLQRRYRLLVRDFAPGKVRAPFVVDLLAPEEWQAAGLPEPFGLPVWTGAGTLAMPAWGTAETVALWRDLAAGAMPRVEGTPMRGSQEEVESLLAADLLGEVELARRVLARQEVRGEAPWLEELLAHALAVSAFRRHEEARWGEIQGLFAALVERGAVAATAADPNGAARATCARNASLFAAAARISDERGGQPSKLLLTLARRRRGVLTAADALHWFPWLAAWSDPA